MSENIEIIIEEEEGEQKATQIQDEFSPREVDEYLDRLQRLQAEFDNYRKRVKGKREQLTEEIQGGLCKQLLPILDDLERAVMHSTGDTNSLRSGVELVYRNLLSVLVNMGLRAIETCGRPFNPQIHEAVMVDVNPGGPDETVSEELQRGYLFKERLLRPAKVKVSKSF